MKGAVKWAIRAVAALIAIAVIGWLGVFAASEMQRGKHYAFVAKPLDLGSANVDAASGAKLVRLFGCDGCHGADLRGQVMFDDPLIGRIWAPNLTLAAKGYSDAQLAAVIRSGVRPNGRALFLMPSEVFSRLTDPEIASVITYMRSRPPGGVVGGEGVEPHFVGRIGLLLGKLPAAPKLVAEARARPLPDFGPDTAGGRRIARACAACHGLDLSGDIGPDLRIAAAYDPPAFERLLRRGIGLDGRPVKPVGAPGEGKSIGEMAEIAPVHFGGLSDADIAALHGYLKARVDHLPS